MIAVVSMLYKYGNRQERVKSFNQIHTANKKQDCKSRQWVIQI